MDNQQQNNSDPEILDPINIRDNSEIDNLPPQAPQPAVPPKNKLPLIISLVIVILLLAAGAVTYYFLIVNKTDSTSPNNKSSTSQSKAENFTAQSLVNKIKSKLTGDILVATDTSIHGGLTNDSTSVYILPSAQVSGRKYWNQPKIGFGIAATGDKETAMTNLDTVKQLLKDAGLSTEGSTAFPTDENMNSSLMAPVFRSADISCTLSVDKYNTYTLGIGCADMSSYVDAAKEIEPFYAAYMATSVPKDAADNLVFGLPEIKAGVDGYKNANIYQGAFVGLYYMEPGKNWTYFIGTQSVLECAQYNTDALRKSFSGETCYDGNGESKVTVE